MRPADDLEAPASFLREAPGVYTLLELRKKPGEFIPDGGSRRIEIGCGKLLVDKWHVAECYQMKIAIALILVVAAAGVAAWLLNRRSGPKMGEIAPAHVLQEKYGLYAESRPVIKLDPAKIPEDLRYLMPLAEKWGIGDDIIRNDLIDKSTDAEKHELHDALSEPYERITAWLNGFGGDAMSDEAVAFMYMQGTLDEMGIFILEEKKNRDIQGSSADDRPKPAPED